MDVPKAISLEGPGKGKMFCLIPNAPPGTRHGVKKNCPCQPWYQPEPQPQQPPPPQQQQQQQGGYQNTTSDMASKLTAKHLGEWLLHVLERGVHPKCCNLEHAYVADKSWPQFWEDWTIEVRGCIQAASGDDEAKTVEKLKGPIDRVCDILKSPCDIGESNYENREELREANRKLKALRRFKGSDSWVGHDAETLEKYCNQCVSYLHAAHPDLYKYSKGTHARRIKLPAEWLNIAQADHHKRKALSQDDNLRASKQGKQGRSDSAGGKDEDVHRKQCWDCKYGIFHPRKNSPARCRYEQKHTALDFDQPGAKESAITNRRGGGGGSGANEQTADADALPLQQAPALAGEGPAPAPEARAAAAAARGGGEDSAVNQPHSAADAQPDLPDAAGMEAGSSSGNAGQQPLSLPLQQALPQGGEAAAAAAAAAEARGGGANALDKCSHCQAAITETLFFGELACCRARVCRQIACRTKCGLGCKPNAPSDAHENPLDLSRWYWLHSAGKCSSVGCSRAGVLAVGVCESCDKMFCDECTPYHMRGNDLNCKDNSRFLTVGHNVDPVEKTIRGHRCLEHKVHMTMKGVFVHIQEKKCLAVKELPILGRDLDKEDMEEMLEKQKAAAERCDSMHTLAEKFRQGNQYDKDEALAKIDLWVRLQKDEVENRAEEFRAKVEERFTESAALTREEIEYRRKHLNLEASAKRVESTFSDRREYGLALDVGKGFEDNAKCMQKHEEKLRVAEAARLDDKNPPESYSLQLNRQLAEHYSASIGHVLVPKPPVDSPPHSTGHATKPSTPENAVDSGASQRDGCDEAAVIDSASLSGPTLEDGDAHSVLSVSEFSSRSQFGV